MAAASPLPLAGTGSPLPFSSALFSSLAADSASSGNPSVTLTMSRPSPTGFWSELLQNTRCMCHELSSSSCLDLPQLRPHSAAPPRCPVRGPCKQQQDMASPLLLPIPNSEVTMGQSPPPPDHVGRCCHPLVLRFKNEVPKSGKVSDVNTTA